MEKKAKPSKITEFLKVYACLVAGSIFGARLRALLTGQPTQGGFFQFTDENGLTYTSSPPVTHLLPGVLFAILAKPPWLLAFLGSALAALILGDELEKRLLIQLGKRITANIQSKTGAPTPAVEQTTPDGAP
jgi:hypothetical protein